MAERQRYVEWEVKLPGRSDNMPPVLACQNHPLNKGKPLVSNTFVMLVKTDLKSMKAAYKYERSMDAPAGTQREWLKMGLFEVDDGDYVFVRDYQEHNASQDHAQLARRDIIAIFASGENHHSQETRSAMDNTMKTVVGKGEGGLTDFENMNRSSKINNSRCYSLATTVEKQTKICAPAAAGKKAGNFEQYNKVTSQVVQAGSRMVVDIATALPNGVQNAIQSNWEVVNHPTAGVFDNYMAPNVQLNISTVRYRGGKGTKRGLQHDIGQFGEAHFDTYDHPAYLTVMLSSPLMPEDADPGHFHILQLGVFTKLKRYRGIVFSGRRKHVGTEPGLLKRRGRSQPAFRINLVFYPTKTCVNGQGRYPIATGNMKQEKDQGILFLTPETRNLSNHTSMPKQTSRTTFAVEGTNIMNIEGLANFYGRGGLEWLTHMLRQVGPEADISIDPVLFSEAITYRNSAGERETLKPWLCAPDVHRTRPARNTAIALFDRYSDGVSKFIPSVVVARSRQKQKDPIDVPGGDGDLVEASELESVSTVEAEDYQDTEDEMEVERALEEGEESDTQREYDMGNSIQGSYNHASDLESEKEETGDGNSVAATRRVAAASEDMDSTMEDHSCPATSEDMHEAEKADSTVDSAHRYDNECMDGTNRASTEALSKTVGTKGAYPNTFKILDEVTLEAVTADTARLRVEMEAFGHLAVNNTKDHMSVGGGAMEELRISFSMLENDPLSSDAPRRAVQVHNQAAWCEHLALRSQLEARVDRAQIMLSSSKARRWVEKDMAGVAKNKLSESIQAKDVRAHDWMDDLVGVLRDGLANGKRSIVLDPVAYPRLKALGSASYDFKNKHAPHRYIGKQDKEKLNDAVRVVLPEWLGFSLPDGKQERNDMVRAWFVEAVQQYIGPKFLATDIAWNIFSTFKTAYVIKSDRIYRTSTPSPRLMEPFIQALKAHPICDSSSEIGAQFKTFCDTIDGECVPVTKSTTPTSLYVQRVDHFFQYVRKGYQVIWGHTDASPCRLADDMRRDSDLHLPLREYASTRARSKSPEGPYDYDFIKTRAGLYSALVWRGVTEGTLFARDGRMSFKDVHDLQLAIDDLASLYPNASSDLTTICQQHVHGRYIETRSVSNALTLWNDVRSLVDWEGFSRSYPSFSNTFGYFFGRADRTEDKRRVEDIDTVSMFNLVCDLVYAGISQPPTEEEMARYITAVKGPSYHAIRYLGLVDYTKELEDEVKEALKHLQEMIVIQFSQHELQLIGMDVIGIEYALGRYFEAKTRLESEGMW